MGSTKGNCLLFQLLRRMGRERSHPGRGCDVCHENAEKGTKQAQSEVNTFEVRHLDLSPPAASLPGQKKKLLKPKGFTLLSNCIHNFQ